MVSYQLEPLNLVYWVAFSDLAVSVFASDVTVLSAFSYQLA